MKYTWLGHASVRLEIGDQVLLIDPWEKGNPMFPQAQRDAMFAGATAILITHGHFDHIAGLGDLARELQVPVYGMVELMSWLAATEAGIATTGFNKGGTVRLGDVAVTMVHAVHSSSVGRDGPPIYAGEPAGYMIEGEGRAVYVSGDTEDIPEMRALENIDLAFVCMNLPFTMDVKQAASAVGEFKPKFVYPYHYRGRDNGTQDPQEFANLIGDGIEVKIGGWYG